MISPAPDGLTSPAARQTSGGAAKLGEWCVCLRPLHVKTHRRLHNVLITIAVATVGVDVICAIVGFLLERHVRQTEIHTIGSAVFWTTTQLLTVSSSITNPLSAGGRVLDVFMEAYAIIVIATLAGAIGNFLRKRAEKIDALAHAAES
jgi:hypothetical protein